MKKWLQISALFTLCIILSACPYTSTVPISEPIVKIDTRLLGKWCSVSDKKCKDMVTISKLDDYRYKVETGSKKTKNYEVYAAWLSNVDGYNYLNMQMSDSGTTMYNFMLVTELDKKQFIYKVIKDADKTPFSNSAELRRWISDNSMNLNFYEAGDTLQRCK